MSAVAVLASTLTVATLNLHGYHPMAEAPRLLQDRDGRVMQTDADLYYFNEAELSRGMVHRAEQLAADLTNWQPDIILFQEVAGGNPQDPQKDCSDFYQAPDFEQARPWGNTVLQIDHFLPEELGYQAALACRGNTGWQTNRNSFVNSRIVRERDGRVEVIHDFGTDPYPHGVLVEGFGALVKAPWRVARQRLVKVPINSEGDITSFHLLVLYDGRPGGEWFEGRWLVVANLHGGHKVHHFEQAVAIRQYLHDYVHRQPGRENYSGLIVGGDFNAKLFRPASNHRFIDVASAPWELHVAGEFDVREGSRDPSAEGLEDLLWELNESPRYKPWSRINGEARARRRIRQAVDRLSSFQNQFVSGLDSLVLSEALDLGNRVGRCHPSEVGDSTCDRRGRIDHIFFDDNLELANTFLIYRQNSWSDPSGTTDHPGVIAQFSVVP